MLEGNSNAPVKAKIACDMVFSKKTHWQSGLHCTKKITENLPTLQTTFF